MSAHYLIAILMTGVLLGLGLINLARATNQSPNPPLVSVATPP